MRFELWDEIWGSRAVTIREVERIVLSCACLPGDGAVMRAGRDDGRHGGQADS
jgi:hypothetical protein